MDIFDDIRYKISMELEKQLSENKEKLLSTFTNNLELENNLLNGNIINKVYIEHVKLENRKFKNTIFEDCNFYGSEFLDCSFNNIIFKNCGFIDRNNNSTIFNDGCKFINCSFETCNMEKIIFKNVEIKNTKFILSGLKQATLASSNIQSIYIKDCDMRGFKLITSTIDTMEFEDEFLTKLDKDTFIDKIIFNKKEVDFYDKIAKIYEDIASKFEANRLLNKSGEYYYLSKKAEYKTLKGLDKIKSYIFWMLCGYGERPTYALITSVEIVLIFTIMYMFTGLDVGIDRINYDIELLTRIQLNDVFFDFMRSLYFSIVTFTTVGYGDITPTGYSLLLSGIEMFLGVTMVGVWTATLARKITR
ncbi:MAG: pentapeptide repeat-containing protein [Romboutsia sp.]